MRRCIAAAAAAAGILATPALGQETLSEDEVRAFFDQTVAEAGKAAETGDWQGASDWIQRHFAADGSFLVEGTLMTGGGPVFTYSASLDGENIQRFAALATAGPMRMAAAGALKDYVLVTDVRYVDALPNGEATAEVAFRETALIDPTLLQAVAPGGDDAATMAIAVQSNSTCEFRLARSADGPIRIRLGTCRATTSF